MGLLNRQNLRLLHLLLVVFLCDNFVQSAPPLDSLLPTIKTLDFELNPSANGYHLRLKTTESERDEVVELKNRDTLEPEITIMGTLRQMFLQEGYELVTTYEADGNGFRSQYKLERTRTLQPTQLTLSPRLGRKSLMLTLGAVDQNNEVLMKLLESDPDYPFSSSYIRA